MTEGQIRNAIKTLYPLIQLPTGCVLVPQRILWSLAEVESSLGKRAEFSRVERSYLPGGKYYNQELYYRYGAAACSSWGVWQVMYPTAVEQGYDGTPWGLLDVYANCICAIRYLNTRAFTQTSPAMTIEEVADAYNSGTHRDEIRPYEYIAKLRQAYNNS